MSFGIPYGEMGRLRPATADRRAIFLSFNTRLSRCKDRMSRKALVILGSQWGDEGKGKIVDLLAENTDLVCRTGGGSNAGTFGSPGKVL